MKKLVLVAIMTMIFGGLYSQQRVVFGVVKYMDYPVKNVIVSAKKSHASVLTNDQGEFEIACAENDIVFFNTENFERVKKRIKQKESIDVNLELKRGVINEQGVILSNYFTPETSEVALYDARNTNESFSIYSNIFELIKAKFPSVRIATTGAFGISEGGSVFIRGRSSILDSGEALYVVDGTVVSDISHIQPNNVKLINILSSTEAVVRFGGDAKNGVVVIRTKSDL